MAVNAKAVTRRIVLPCDGLKLLELSWSSRTIAHAQRGDGAIAYDD
jgi:hypothetical protein